MIGGGWAARFLLNGWDVRVFDPDPEAERKIGRSAGQCAALTAGPVGYGFAPVEGKLTFHDRPSSEAVQRARAWIQESRAGAD